MEIYKLVGILFVTILLIVVGSRVIFKNDFAVITGYVSLTANTQTQLNNNQSTQTTWTINFPSGFNKDNCVLVSFGGKHYTSTEGATERGYGYGISASVSQGMLLGTTEGTFAVLGYSQDTTKIFCGAENWSTNAKPFYYKMVLMKTD